VPRNTVFACVVCGVRLPAGLALEPQFCQNCGCPLPQASRVQDSLIGRVISNGYVLLSCIGEGGMARVYRAEQSELGHTVAVKVLHRHLLSNPSIVERFLIEARAISLLNHPHAVNIIDFDRTDDGLPYLVMEFLHGQTLSDVLRKEGPLPFDRAIDIIRQILSTLSAAHALGIIHRDLKPRNIVLEPLRSGGDFVKVVDFGLAKLLNEGPTNVSIPGFVSGTPQYMAPEQARGEVDIRSDFYALGIVLFRMLTGSIPFDSVSPTEVLMMQVSMLPPDPRDFAPQRCIPASLAELTLRALAKSPDERFQTADEFRQALDHVLNDLYAQTGQCFAVYQCPRCGGVSSQQSGACEQCGLPMSVSIPDSKRSKRPSDVSQISGRYSGPQVKMPLAERDEELGQLLERWTEMNSRVQAVRLVGASGVGKTRLLDEIRSYILPEPQATVVAMRPDPWGANVSFYGLSRLLTELGVLLSVPSQPEDWQHLSSPTLARGFRRIYRQPLNSELEPGETRNEVYQAVLWVLRHLTEGTEARTLLITIDDLPRLDMSSRQAIRDLIEFAPQLPIMIISCHESGYGADWAGEAIEIQGVSAECAERWLPSFFKQERPTGGSERVRRHVVPLLVDQIVRFEHEGGAQPPARLADVIALRMEHLDEVARSLLQALAVLGTEVELGWFRKLMPRLGSTLTLHLERLLQANLIEMVDEENLRFTHPLFRELALTTLPVGARRQLFSKALRVFEQEQAPVEVRARCAAAAEHTFEALVLFEMAGDKGAERGDFEAALYCYQACIDVARRELVRGEMDDPTAALLHFSFKLAQVLTSQGKFVHAEGILREALDIEQDSSSEREAAMQLLDHVIRERYADQDEAERVLRQVQSRSLHWTRHSAVRPRAGFHRKSS
jgi:serine/threonine protein kinase